MYSRIKMTIIPLWLMVGSGFSIADTINVSYENPGVENASSVVVGNANTLGIENFDSRASGGFTTDFGTGGVITGTYSSGTQIRGADRYGGAGPNGSNFASTSTTAGYILSLATNGVAGVNYFGFWLSALDRGNQLAFYRSGGLVGTYTPQDLVTAVGACPNGSNPYCGNPNTGFLGQNEREPYAFVNFVDTTGYFDEVRFSENPEVGGYESDNHTVAYCSNAQACISGTSLNVPEPISLALVGISLVGLGFSRRKKA